MIRLFALHNKKRV